MASDPESLHRQIDQLRHELAGVAPDDPRRRALLARLGAALWTRVDQHGLLADLDEVIAVGWELVALTPPGDPWRSRVLADLGQALMNLFHRSGGRTELDPAVELLREAVALTPFDHPNRERYVRRLAGALGARFDRTHDEADGEAVSTFTREIEQHEIARDRVAAERRREAARPAPERLDEADGTGSWDWIEQERGPSKEERGPGEPFFGGAPEPPPGPAPPPPPAAAPAPPGAPPPPPAAAPAPPAGLPPIAPRPASPAAPPPGAPAGAARPAPVQMPDLGRIPQPTDSTPSRAVAPPEPADDRQLEFAAAYQPAVSQGTQYPFLFYVHRPGEREAVRALIERRAPQLGGRPSVSQGEAAQDVRAGTILTIVPNVLGAAFEPSRLEVAVGDSLRELTFQMTVAGSTTPGPIDGYVDIFVGALIIGQVSVAFEVQAAAAPPVPAQSPGAKLMQIANATIFDKIFISYSQKDSTVVDLCVATYDGLGVTVFLDRHELRSGDEWRAVLSRLITEADVFQLYWSAAASASSEVQHEWRTALALSKSRDLGRRRPSSFIRPLYWEQPLPPIPEALSHLHFSRLDLKQLRRAAKVYVPEAPGLLRRALAALRLG